MPECLKRWGPTLLYAAVSMLLIAGIVFKYTLIRAQERGIETNAYTHKDNVDSVVSGRNPEIEWALYWDVKRWTREYQDVPGVLRYTNIAMEDDRITQDEYEWIRDLVWNIRETRKDERLREMKDQIKNNLIRYAE